jgi:hypothetical protein
MAKIRESRRLIQLYSQKDTIANSNDEINISEAAFLQI